MQMRVTELMLRGAQDIDDAVRPDIAHKPVAAPDINPRSDADTPQRLA